MSFNVHTIYRQIFKIWRKRRFDLFLEVLKPAHSDTLLDVGGWPSSWTDHPSPVARIDVLNIHAIPWSSAEFPDHPIRTIIGDGCALEMEAHSYDIGFSNSVIEHLGSWERQQQFASEIQRVAKSIWVQTPAYECPIEPHYMTPFVHYFPARLQKRLIRWGTVWGWVQRPEPEEVKWMVESTRLLRKAEMQQLFPDCEIRTEYLVGKIPKSYIAIRTKNSV